MELGFAGNSLNLVGVNMKRKMEVKFGKDKLIFKLDELVDLIEKEFGRKNQGTRIHVQLKPGNKYIKPKYAE